MSGLSKSDGESSSGDDQGKPTVSVSEPEILIRQKDEYGLRWATSGPQIDTDRNGLAWRRTGPQAVAQAAIEHPSGIAGGTALDR